MCSICTRHVSHSSAMHNGATKCEQCYRLSLACTLTIHCHKPYTRVRSGRSRRARATRRTFRSAPSPTSHTPGPRASRSHPACPRARRRPHTARPTPQTRRTPAAARTRPLHARPAATLCPSPFARGLGGLCTTALCVRSACSSDRRVAVCFRSSDPRCDPVESLCFS